MSRNITLLSKTITTAVSIVAVPFGNIPDDTKTLTLEAIFTYGSGGTTAIAYVQTTLDGGVTWFDIACFSFTTASASKIANLTSRTAVTTLATPVDGALTANTVVDGLIGSQLRTKYVTTGTYAGSTTLKIVAKLNS